MTIYFHLYDPAAELSQAANIAWQIINSNGIKKKQTTYQ